MKIILIQDVAHIGSAGTICSVSDGYARSFLLPNNLALETSSVGGKQMVARYADKVAKQTGEKEQEKQLLESVPSTIEISRKANEQGVLFESVSEKHIAHALGGIQEEHISVETPIKEVGEHVVTVGGRDVVVSVVSE